MSGSQHTKKILKTIDTSLHDDINIGKEKHYQHLKRGTYNSIELFQLSVQRRCSRDVDIIIICVKYGTISVHSDYQLLVCKLCRSASIRSFYKQSIYLKRDTWISNIKQQINLLPNIIFGDQKQIRIYKKTDSVHMTCMYMTLHQHSKVLNETGISDQSYASRERAK